MKHRVSTLADKLGQVRHRQLIDQTAQALCVTLVVNCIAAYKESGTFRGRQRMRVAADQRRPVTVCDQ